MTECPLGAYWICHAIIANVIALIVTLAGLIFLPLLISMSIGAVIGAGFYVLREVIVVLSYKADEREAEGLTRFDWPGFLAPVISVSIVYAICLSWLI